LTTNINSICKSNQLNATVCDYLRANVTTAYYASRVDVIQHQQLMKGALTFYNYLINKYSLFFFNAIPVSSSDVVELTQGYNIMAIYEIYLMELWLATTTKYISTLIV
jgi:hypothetical protein